MKNLSKYSNYSKVKQVGKKFNLNVLKSTNKNKKYMIIKDNKKIHFGTMNPAMEDFTKHKDEKRRKNFRNRNKKWAEANKYTPAWLSYHILW